MSILKECECFVVSNQLHRINLQFMFYNIQEFVIQRLNSIVFDLHE